MINVVFYIPCTEESSSDDDEDVTSPADHGVYQAAQFPTCDHNATMSVSLAEGSLTSTAVVSPAMSACVATQSDAKTPAVCVRSLSECVTSSSSVAVSQHQPADITVSGLIHVLSLRVSDVTDTQLPASIVMPKPITSNRSSLFILEVK